MISAKYDTLAKKIIQTLLDIREDMRAYESWTPVQEIIRPIDTYFAELDSDWPAYGGIDSTYSKENTIPLLGAESEWYNRLYGRLKRANNRLVKIGVDACEYAKEQSQNLYDKIRGFAEKHPTKAALAAYFGTPVIFTEMLTILPYLKSAVSTTSAILISKEAVQVAAETILEETPRLVKWTADKFFESVFGKNWKVWVAVIGAGGVAGLYWYLHKKGPRK